MLAMAEAMVAADPVNAEHRRALVMSYKNAAEQRRASDKQGALELFPQGAGARGGGARGGSCQRLDWQDSRRYPQQTSRAPRGRGRQRASSFPLQQSCRIRREGGRGRAAKRHLAVRCRHSSRRCRRDAGAPWSGGGRARSVPKRHRAPERNQRRSGQPRSPKFASSGVRICRLCLWRPGRGTPGVTAEAGTHACRSRHVSSKHEHLRRAPGPRRSGLRRLGKGSGRRDRQMRRRFSSMSRQVGGLGGCAQSWFRSPYGSA